MNVNHLSNRKAPTGRQLVEALHAAAARGVSPSRSGGTPLPLNPLPLWSRPPVESLKPLNKTGLGEVR